MNPTLAQRVHAAIEEYLAVHPQAADSAAGVARWWLAPSGITATVEETEQVLAQMTDRHLLRCVRLADGTTLYSKARSAVH
jgi:hypothetical protein